MGAASGRNRRRAGATVSRRGRAGVVRRFGADFRGVSGTARAAGGDGARIGGALRAGAVRTP